jgi:6-phosphofructokinase 1
LTSGGDAPGTNAVIAGACARAAQLGGRAIRTADGFAGLAALREVELDGLVVIGGHGSAEGARVVAAPAGAPVAFVPATIDRDVAGTELTIGMDSAIAYGIDAVDRLRITGRSLQGRGFLLQTLGAPHGYLADAVAAAAAVDHFLVPERPLDLEHIARERSRTVTIRPRASPDRAGGSAAPPRRR